LALGGGADSSSPSSSRCWAKERIVAVLGALHSVDAKWKRGLLAMEDGEGEEGTDDVAAAAKGFLPPIHNDSNGIVDEKRESKKAHHADPYSYELNPNSNNKVGMKKQPAPLSPHSHLDPSDAIAFVTAAIDRYLASTAGILMYNGSSAAAAGAGGGGAAAAGEGPSNPAKRSCG